MLYREIIAVCSEIHTKYINTLCGENVELLNVNPLRPSGHYTYRQFNIQQFYVLPTQCIVVCFVWISEQTAIISLYSINWLVFVTEI